MSGLSGFISNFGGVVSPLDLMSSIQTNSNGGYIQLNNFILQFSMGPVTTSTVTYPKQFTNCWGAYATAANSNNQVTISTTNTVLTISSGGASVYWFAWGN